MGFLRGVPLLRPHPAAVWMWIAPSQSDARYPYGQSFSQHLPVELELPHAVKFLLQVPNLGTCPFSYHNHRHLLLHKHHGIRFEKCAWFSKNCSHSGVIVPSHMQASRSVRCPGFSAALLLGWCAECGTSPRQRYLHPRLLIHFSRCNQLF